MKYGSGSSCIQLSYAQAPELLSHCALCWTFRLPINSFIDSSPDLEVKLCFLAARVIVISWLYLASHCGWKKELLLTRECFCSYCVLHEVHFIIICRHHTFCLSYCFQSYTVRLTLPDGFVDLW